MKTFYIDNAIGDQQRGDILFAGDIIIYRQLPAMLSLIEFSDQLLRHHLALDTPTLAHTQLSDEEFLTRSCAAQKAFRLSATARKLFFEVLTQCGINTSHTYYDHFPMRIVPCCANSLGAHRSAIGHHRDTWGSNLQSQLNWWAPLYEIEAQRSITLYPNYWQQPLANTTADWSFKEYLATRAKGVEERQINYPSAPQPIESVDETQAVQLMLKPGDVLNFSSAHLHASAINTTSHIRYSVEMRTLSQHDLTLQRGALNVDNHGKEAMYQWFKNISDGQILNR